MVGRLDNNMLCEFPGDAALAGSFVKVRINDIKGAVLVGELV